MMYLNVKIVFYYTTFFLNLNITIHISKTSYFRKKNIYILISTYAIQRSRDPTDTQLKDEMKSGTRSSSKFIQQQNGREGVHEPVFQNWLLITNIKHHHASMQAFHFQINNFLSNSYCIIFHLFIQAKCCHQLGNVMIMTIASQLQQRQKWTEAMSRRTIQQHGKRNLCWSNSSTFQPGKPMTV